jgi:protein-S-isoprenylcysteine O-methyltransferase Ste14
VNHKRIAVLQGVAILAAFVYAGFRFRGQEWTWMSTLGLALSVPAFAAWVLARVQLGGSFSVSAKARKLVTHGIYSKIRNPIYVFGTVSVSGFILLFNKPIWLLLVLVIVPMQIVRARKEAKVLEDKFGDEYREYRGKTWF